MLADCHMHMLLDGDDWRTAIRRHKAAPDEAFIRAALEKYRDLGFTYLRDGGDRWGVGARARELAPEYGICYRTPLAPLHRRGHYGGFIGLGFESLGEYAALVRQQKENGADFVKIMISGLMDFDRCGVLTEDGLPADEIREVIRIAHEEGQAVMAHANGSAAVEAAAAAGVDSIEHGAYLDSAALEAMAETGTVWVPTLATVGNLRGKGRFSEEAVEAILESTRARLMQFAAMGGLIAPGSDAGAWSVPHGDGGKDEYTLLSETLGEHANALLERGIREIMRKF